ncbi:MAG TPA: hypothetical protein VIY49_38600 [Bryobacteraceae bacterium]
MHNNLWWPTVVVFTILGVGNLSAQDKPNFKGTWVSERQPQTLTITQDALRLTQTGPEGTLTYQLDGSDSRNETKTVLGEKWIHISKIKWVGSALVITTTTTPQTGGSWDWMKIYTLSQTGTLKLTTVDGVLSDRLYMNVNTVTFTLQK